MGDNLLESFAHFYRKVVCSAMKSANLKTKARNDSLREYVRNSLVGEDQIFHLIKKGSRN